MCRMIPGCYRRCSEGKDVQGSSGGVGVRRSGLERVGSKLRVVGDRKGFVCELV